MSLVGLRAFVAFRQLCELSTIFIPTLKMWKLRSREVKCKEPKVTRLGEHGLESLTQESWRLPGQDHQAHFTEGED